jgi:putative peptidoglycan lipid II flippase
VQAVVLFWFWRRIGLRFRPDFQWRGVGLSAAGRMAGWTFGMLLLTTVAGIVQTQVVLLASGEGASLAAIDNAWLVFMLPHSVITVSIATAYFTRMSEHAHAGSIDKVRDDLSSAVRGVSVILVLASAVLVVVAYPFAAVFQPGLAGASALGNVIIAFAIGLLGFSILFVVQRTFYALGDTRTPFFFTLFQVIVFSIAALACMLLPVEWIAVGVALSTTIATTAQLLLAVWLLRRRLGLIDGRRVTLSIVRDLGAVVVPVAVGIVLLVALGGFVDGGFAITDRIGAIVSMAIIGVFMAVLYFGILWMLRSPELRGFAAPLLARLRRS